MQHNAVVMSSGGGSETQVDPIPLPAGRQDSLVQSENCDPDLGACKYSGQLSFGESGEQRGDVTGGLRANLFVPRPHPQRQ